MSLDNIRLSYKYEDNLVSVKADYTLGTLTIESTMNNRIKLNIQELEYLVDTLIKLQNIDTKEYLDSIKNRSIEASYKDKGGNTAGVIHIEY